MRRDSLDPEENKEIKLENDNLSLDSRVIIDSDQVAKIAQVIKSLPEESQPDFVGEYLPPIDHPLTLEYFFAVTLQQFGFWEIRDGQYDKPLFAVMNGKKMKGSTYLFYAYTRILAEDPRFFTPETQGNLSLSTFKDVFRDDNGVVQMPAIELHLQMARKYGKDMLNGKLTSEKILQKSRDSEEPLGRFLSILSHIGGYKEDPLCKKANLLALCLSQRPEKFLTYSNDETIGPIVDYHCMRSTLRIGMVDIMDKNLFQKLTYRMVVNPEEEWAVRFATYNVIKRLVTLSGKSISVVDAFLFQYMRSHCPEMTEPICAECLLDQVCVKRKALFQPVIRTTFY